MREEFSAVVARVSRIDEVRIEKSDEKVKSVAEVERRIAQ